MLSTRRRARGLQVLTFLPALVLCAGCSLGPKALERSHGRYYEAVRHVEEEQLLRNIVHVRYNETPAHLNVSSIATQYELTSQAEARPFFVSPNPGSNPFRTFTSILPDAEVSGATRPTLTLTPVDDNEEVQRFLTPISIETLVFLSGTSWPASTILRLWVERLNGVPNAPTASGPQQDTPPDLARFLRLTQLMQSATSRELLTVHSEESVTPVGAPLAAAAVTAAAQVEAAKTGLEYVEGADPTSRVLVRRPRKLVLEFRVGPEADPELAELFQLLNLDPARRHFDLIATSSSPPDPLHFPRPTFDQVLLEPRSASQVFYFLANGVEVPIEHLKCGLVRQPVDALGQPVDMREVTSGLFEVHVCKGHHPPRNAYVAISYRDHWYYIDDADQASKATLVLMLQLSRLDFHREHPPSTLLTLPIGR
jgi:hypothetical protein